MAVKAMYMSEQVSKQDERKTVSQLLTFQRDICEPPEKIQPAGVKERGMRKDEQQHISLKTLQTGVLQMPLLPRL